MPYAPSPPRTAASLLRHHAELLALLSLAFILQAGLVPFDFRFDGGAAAPHPQETIGLGLPILDVVANLFLFVPLGFFVRWSLARRCGSSMASRLTLLFAALLSGGIEWVQHFSPSRVSSMADVVCNVTGTALGGFLSWIGRLIVPRVMGAAIYEFRTRPAATMLKGYCLLLVAAAALPFSFAFDAQRLNLAAKQAVFTPFGESRIQRESANGPVSAAIDTRATMLAEWSRMKRWSRWAAEAVSFAVLFLWLQIVLRDDYRFRPRGAVVLGWWLCAMFAAALSVLQFPVVTRGLDVTDVLFRLVGAAAGLIVLSLRGVHGQTIGRCAALLVASFILYNGLLPFRFERPSGGVAMTLASSAFFPFMAYFVTRSDLMFTDVMEKCTAYLLLGASLAATWSCARRSALGSRILRVCTLGVGLASAVEIAQMFLPVRVVSLTDPILAAVGCWVGVVLQEHAARFARHAATATVVDSQGRRLEPGSGTPLALMDQLWGKLMDADARAPTEPGRIRTFHPPS